MISYRWLSRPSTSHVYLYKRFIYSEYSTNLPTMRSCDASSVTNT